MSLQAGGRGRARPGTHCSHTRLWTPPRPASAADPQLVARLLTIGHRIESKSEERRAKKPEGQQVNVVMNTLPRLCSGRAVQPQPGAGLLARASLDNLTQYTV
jgi:hypothetical protein